MTERWSEQFFEPPGFIAEQGAGEFQHKFGGTAWQAVDEDRVCGGPALLLTLDLCDPKLASLALKGLTELPLCSYIDGSPWSYRQIYQIVPQDRRIILVEREDPNPECAPEAEIPNPLPETEIRLRPMNKSEYPTDFETYINAFDDFAGGEAFIRILGTPLVSDVMTATCACGQTLDYVASIGYQSSLTKSGFMNKEPFFIGEGFLYFFLCRSCLKFQVTSQGT